MVVGRRRFVAVVAAAVVAALSVATVGVPATLLGAGAWSFAALFNRWAPGLSGPTSWVAGIVAEATVLIAESAALALVAPHPHPQWVYVVVLLVPPALALLAHERLSRVPRSRASRDSRRVSGEPWLAVLAVVVIEAMFEAIKLHGHDFGLTWFMASDARNQVVGNRAILAAGGITLKEMSSYPALVNAVCAIIDGAGGRADLNTAVLMVRDIQAMVATVILSSIALALAFIAAVVETVPWPDGRPRRLPPRLALALVGCGSLAISAFVLGLSASGGFLSAIGALVFCVAGLVLGLRVAQHYDNLTLVLLTLTLVLAMGSWTFVFVVPALAMVVGIVGGVRYLHSPDAPASRERTLTRASVGFALVTLVAVGGVLLLKLGTLTATLKASGGIIAPNPGLFFYWLGPIAFASVFTAPKGPPRRARVLLVAEFVVLALTTLWIRRLHPFGQDWSYYATKMLWLATATIVWAPFVLLIDLVRKLDLWVRRVGPRAVTNAVVSIAGSGVIIGGIGHETPFPFLWQWAYVGSTYPSPRVVDAVLQEAAKGGPFVVWLYTPELIDNRLGNFWSALAWDYSANATVLTTKNGNSFMSWAYNENDTPAALCTAVTDFKTRVITSDPHVIVTLRATCPAYRRLFPASAAGPSTSG